MAANRVFTSQFRQSIVQRVLKGQSVGVLSQARCKIAELERRLGRMTLENDFLKRAFKRVKEAHSKSNAPGDVRCTEK